MELGQDTAPETAPQGCDSQICNYNWPGRHMDAVGCCSWKRIQNRYLCEPWCQDTSPACIRCCASGTSRPAGCLAWWPSPGRPEQPFQTAARPHAPAHKTCTQSAKVSGHTLGHHCPRRWQGTKQFLTQVSTMRMDLPLSDASLPGPEQTLNLSSLSSSSSISWVQDEEPNLESFSDQGEASCFPMIIDFDH